LFSSILFNQNYKTTAQVVVNQGGTSSGKTYAILQALFCLACTQPKVVITVVGQDIPNLKAGALRDALSIYHSLPILQKLVKSYNRTERVFEFTNGSIIEFNSYDNWQDAKSGKRDYLFINEANGIPWDVYTELSLRTKKRVSTASIVASVMTTYFELKGDINEVKMQQEAQTRVNEIRLKVLEGQVAVLQTQVEQLKKHRY